MTINPIIASLRPIKKIRFLFAITFALSVIIASFVYHMNANAAATQSFVRFDRMQTSTASTGTVCLMPATTSTDVKTWTVTFPTGYTVSTTAANWQTSNISTTNLAWPGSPTAWPNSTSATASVSGQTVTWTNTAVQTMNSGTLYCYNWTSSAAVSIASSANSSLTGTIATFDHLAAQIDSAGYSTAAVSSDQIAVSATVPQTFSFALSSTTDALGSLNTSSVVTSSPARTATVNTNAKNGWMVWAKDAYQGLCSPSVGTCTVGTPTTQIATTATASNRTLTGGTTDYNTGLTSTQAGGTGTLSVASPFVGTGAGQGGGLSATALQTLASSTGTASNAVLTLKNNVAISGAVPAANDYGDVITVVGAGLF